MRTCLRLPTLAVALLAAAGCVLPDDVARLQQDVADVRNELAKVKADQAAAAESARKLEARLGNVDAVPRTEFADLKLQVDGFRRQMTALDERIVEAERRMERVGAGRPRASRELSRRAGFPPAIGAPPDRLRRALPRPRAFTARPTPTSPRGTGPWPPPASRSTRERSRTAIRPTTPSTGSPSALRPGEIRGCPPAYDRMLERYPRSEKAAAANLKKALALLEKNEVGKASAQLRHVVDTYPGTDEAQDRLGPSGGPGALTVRGASP